MAGMLRWTEDDLKRFAAKNKATVRTHKIQDEPEPDRRVDGKPRKVKTTGRQRLESMLEVAVAQQLTLLQLPMPKRNYVFLPERKFELDFAWPEKKVAVEVQGMAHRIKARFKADIEKRALALLAGWRVLEVDGENIRSGQASRWIEELLR